MLFALMSLFSKSIWIFVAMLCLLSLVAVYPSPPLIGITILLGSLLVVWQTILILKDPN